LQVASFFETVGYDTDPTTGLYTNQWVPLLTENQGSLDAAAAWSAAKSIGQPEGSAIYFAMDLNPGATGSGISLASALGEIDSYFQGISAYFKTNGVPYSIGVYGAGATLTSVISQGLASYSWLASPSSWAGFTSWEPPGATVHNWSLHQVANGAATISGISFDTDESSGQYFGQWTSSGAVLPPSSGTLPDLVIDSLTITPSVSLGSGFDVGTTIGNNSTVSAGAFDVKIYLSPDQHFDSNAVLLADDPVTSLAGNASVPWGETALLPSWITTPGTYYAIVYANPNQALAESNYANDSYSTPFTVTAPCFAAGTRIATARGEVAVEELRVGDLLRTVLGEGPAPIIWIGQREADCTRHAQPRKVWPVRVAAGAFGPGRPHADLFLSPDHAVYVGEVLIPVRHLINGSTIAQVPVERVTYYHLELAEHNVLLAEGMPAESFLDMKDGSNYANRPGPVRLYPDFAARMWEAFGCARLVVTGPELDAARALVGRFAAIKAAA
jgi:hypothetical protein